MNFLEQTFYHNTVKDWIIALAAGLAVFVVLRILKTIVYRRAKALAKKTSTDVDDFVADLFRHIKFFFLFLVAVYAGSQFLTLPPTANVIISKLLVIALLIQGAIWGSAIFEYWLEKYKKQKTEDTTSLTTFKALGFIARVALWSFVLLVTLDNLGIDITALVTGLGVGGIAVALAVQNILGDLFASMSIVLDKPFVIGDFIVVDNLMGSVEHIGLKTTRLRSLGGEQLIFANGDLLKSRIHNYKRMEERRVIFSLGVTYQTPAEKLAAIPRIVQEIVEAQELTRFERSHFKRFGDFSLDFENVYYVQSPDYNTYMNIQQDVNLAISRRFQEEGIEFAYPTQTVFLEKTSSRDSK